MSFNKERAIIAQNSATAAATIVAGLKPEGVDVLGLFEHYRTAIFNGTLALAGAESVVEGLEGPADRPSYQRASAGSGDGEVGDIVFKGGKHAGMTIAEVYEVAPDYVEWAASDKNRNDFMRTRTQKFLAQVA